MKKKRNLILLGFVMFFISFVLFSGNKIKANDTEAILSVGSVENENSIFSKSTLRIPATKDRIVKLKTRNSELLNWESFFEQVPEKYQDRISLVKDAENENDELEMKFAKSNEPYEIPFKVYFSQNNSENSKDADVELSIDGEEVSKQTIELPEFQSPNEVEKIDLPKTTDIKGRSLARNYTARTYTPPSVTYTEVSTWAQFLSAINSNTEGIRLTADLTSANASSVSINRNLVIDGNGHKINYAGTANHSIPIGAVSSETTLTIMNLEYSSSSNSTNSIFSASTANNPNWTINVSNVKTGSDNSRSFLTIPGGKVNIYDENTLVWNYGGAAYGMITANQVNLIGNLSYSSTNANGHLFRNALAGAKFTIQSDSQLTVNSLAAVFNSTGTSVDVTATIDTAAINLTKATSLITSSGTLTGTISNSNIAIGTLSSSLFNSTGAMALEVTNTPINATSIGGIATSTQNTNVKFLNSLVKTETMTGSIVTGATINSNFSNSPITVSTTYSAVLFNVDTRNSVGSTVEFYNSNLYLRQTAANSNIGFNFNGTTAMLLSDSSLDFNSQSTFMNFTPYAPNSSLSIQGTSKVTGNTVNKQVLNTGSGDTQSPNFKMTVDGKEAEVNLTSTSTETAGDGGVLSITGAGSEIRVSNGSKLSIDSQKGTPAIMIQAEGGGFYISEGSSLSLKNTGDSNTLAATLRFRVTGGMTYELSEESTMKIEKKGRVSALRMYGGDNKVWIKSASNFLVTQNSSVTSASNGGDGNSQQAIQYRGSGDNQFVIEDENSNVSLSADYGPAIDSNSNLSIKASDKTYFVARGNTAGASNGIFNAGVATIDFGTMKYFDFVNTRSGGGSVINVAGGSSFVNAETNVSLWKRGTNVNNNPDKDFNKVSYSLSGANLGTWVSGDDEVKSFLSSNGSMINITRMNGNNQAAVIDELRVPTDADKFIYGHASVPEGKGEVSRDAYTGEVKVKVDVYDSSGTEKIYSGLQGEVVEGTAGSGELSVYGDAARKGIFKITVPDGAFLKANSKIVVTDAWRGDIDAGKATISQKPNDFTAPDRTVLDVTPPEPTKLTDENLNNATKVLSGKNAEANAKVYVYYNTGDKDSGTLLGSTTVDVNGDWTFNLPYYVDKTKELSVYLEDTVGKITAAQLVPKDPSNPSSEQIYDQIGLIKPPVTNTEAGNINPYTDLNYHDAVFKGVKKYTVADVIPDQPDIVKSVVSSGGTIASVGDTLTYTLVTSNKKANSENWKNVVITDVLPEGLKFDPEKSKVTIAGVAATKDQYNYDADTRTLTIKIGDIAANASITTSFDAVLETAAYNKEIKNKATASGDSPQEKPFVAGPINPDSMHETISADSNEVGVPGTTVKGTLSLVSAPEKIDFGKKKTTAYGEFTAEKPSYDLPLIVNDTRPVSTGWSLTVTLNEVMTYDDDHSYKMPDALVYKKGTSETPLEENMPLVILSTAKDEAVGDYNISDKEWEAKGDGFKLVLKASQYRKDGDYTGKMTFTLNNTP